MPNDATSFPVRILDALGPAWFRRLPLLVAAGLALAALPATALSPPVAAAVFCLAFAALIMPSPVLRLRARAGRLRCLPGAVEVTKAGVASQTLRARDLVGATTASVRGKISLVLAHRKRRLAPVVLELSSRAELDAVCRSLGIGHHGFGQVGWGVRRGKGSALEVTMRMLTSMLLVFFPVAMLIGGDLWDGLGGLAALAAMGAGALAAGAWAIGTGVAPSVYMDPSGLSYGTGVRRRQVSFGAIHRLELMADDIHVVTDSGEHGQQHDWLHAPPSRFAREGMSAEEREHAFAQMEAAVERAHGRFVLKEEAASTVDVLRRNEGEPAGAWLARLDALSAVVGVQGYRGGALEVVDVERVLADPEAPADMRAGAARVLRRVGSPDDVRVRIADVLSATREPSVRKRIAAAIDDDIARAEMVLDEELTPEPTVPRAAR